MIGELIIKMLVLVFGYAYPTFESFRIIERTIERKRPCTERLLFWCQYWVIIAMITAVEKIGDIFVSWVPFYGESKLAFVIYLWHPKTKGTDFVYNTVVRPFMAQHETDMEKRLQGMMSKSANLLIFYLNHFADKGQSMAFEIFEHLLSRSVVRNSSVRDQNDTYTSFEHKDNRKKKSLFKFQKKMDNDEEEDDDKSRIRKLQNAFMFPNGGVSLAETSRLRQTRKR